MSILLLMVCVCSFATDTIHNDCTFICCRSGSFSVNRVLFDFIFLQQSLHDINGISFCGIAAIDTTTFQRCIQMHWTNYMWKRSHIFPVHQFFIILETLEMDNVTYTVNVTSLSCYRIRNRNIDNWEIEDYSILCLLARNCMIVEPIRNKVSVKRSNLI